MANSQDIRIQGIKHTQVDSSCMLLLILILHAVISLPLNVRATQSGSSAPVEVSWSPPSDGHTSITGYRIFYGNGQNVFVQSVTAITSVDLNVEGDYVGCSVSIRSESDQFYSELISVPVTHGKCNYCNVGPVYVQYYSYIP